MNKGLFCLLVTVALLNVGCGSTSKQGTQEFNTSNELAKAQKFEEAIAYLQQAVQKAPKNKEFAQRLSQLRSDYFKKASIDIQNLLRGELTKAKLDKVEEKINGLRSVNIKESLITPLSSNYEQVSETFYNDLKISYEQAISFIDQAEWVNAHQQLKTIEQQFANYEDVSRRLNNVESQALKSYVRTANDALKKDDFNSAEVAIDSLLKILPNNPIASNLDKKLRNINRPQYFISKAKQAFAAQDWQTVISSCQRAVGYNVDLSECVQISDTATQNLIVDITASIDSTIQENRFFRAASFYNQLREMKSSSGQKLSLLQDRLTRSIAESITNYRMAGNHAMAWHLLKLNESLDPFIPDLNKQIRDAEDQIFTKSRRSIAVFDFNNPSESSNSGVIVANNLISKLFNNASSDIRIIERDSLKSILSEMKMNQSNTVSESTAKQMGQAYGIDYAIIGSVLIYQVDESTSRSSKSVRYKVGERIEDNIDYLNWKAANPRPSKSEMQEAPQAKIMVPEYGQKDYEVTQTKKVGFIQLSFRIVDVLTGENTRVETIEKTVQVSDIANAGVEEAGIKFDEMQIATDTEILQGLTDEIVENMAAEILKPLQRLEAYYFDEGIDKERRQELDEAVQYYTYAIFNEKLKSVSNSPVTKAAQEKLDTMLANYRFIVQK